MGHTVGIANTYVHITKDRKSRLKCKSDLCSVQKLLEFRNMATLVYCLFKIFIFTVHWFSAYLTRPGLVSEIDRASHQMHLRRVWDEKAWQKELKLITFRCEHDWERPTFQLHYISKDSMDKDYLYWLQSSTGPLFFIYVVKLALKKGI